MSPELTIGTSMSLLVHAVGEADLLLDASKVKLPGEERDSQRALRIRARRDRLTAACDDADSVVRLLVEGSWSDGYDSTTPPTPLLTALRTVADAPGWPDAPDLDLVFLGTRQDPPGELDTFDLAEVLVRAVPALAEHAGCRVRSVRAVPVSGLTERSVVGALGGHLDRNPADRAVVTWGSGASALPLGAMTALSQAGVPWRLVTTSESGEPEIVDLLEGLGVNPVIGVLVRWRLFEALVEFAEQQPPAVSLDGRQLALLERAVARRRRGIEECDAPSMRAVVADAVVRRDGTDAMAVRRYVVSRYEALLAVDQRTHPNAKDLLEYLEKSTGGPPLGVKISKIRKASQRGGSVSSRDPLEAMVRASTGLQSYRWLLGNDVDDLQEIGRGSHRLRKSQPDTAARVGNHLAQWDVDGTGWAEAKLPVPPLAPADTVLVVWPSGRKPREVEDDKFRTIGEQLIADGVPRPVGEYLDLDRCRISAFVLATDDAESRTRAHGDVERLRASGHVARFAPIDPGGGDPAALEATVEALLTAQTGALLLVPTGPKAVVRALLQAMRRVGAWHGLPLFVRENVVQRSDGALARAAVYLWPALTGGDLPLLYAARKALSALELDVAWRLLAASAADRDFVERVRQFGTVFASRHPDDEDQWRDIHGVTVPHGLLGRTLGMAAQRIALVQAVLARKTERADRIRLLVLAADVLEASIAATRPADHSGARYREFRDGLKSAATGHASTAGPARVLLLLNDARDKASITHGTEDDPDAVVEQQAARLAKEWGIAGETLPQDVVTLIDRVVDAALSRGLGQPDHRDDLTTLHRTLLAQIEAVIDQRRSLRPCPRQISTQ